MTLFKNPIIYKNPKTVFENVLHVLNYMIQNCNINRKLTHHSGLQATKKVKLHWEIELLKLHLYVSHFIKKVNDFQIPDFHMNFMIPTLSSIVNVTYYRCQRENFSTQKETSNELITFPSIYIYNLPFLHLAKLPPQRSVKILRNKGPTMLSPFLPGGRIPQTLMEHRQKFSSCLVDFGR